MLWNQHLGLRSTQRLGPSLSIGVEPYVSRSYLEAGVGALNLESGFWSSDFKSEMTARRFESRLRVWKLGASLQGFEC